jgi:hypothetical protein
MRVLGSLLRWRRSRARAGADPRQQSLAEHKRSVREQREAQDYPSRGGGVVGR